MLTTGVALWSLFTVVTPQAAAAGTAPLLAARVLLGVGEGVAFPAIHSIIGEQDAACRMPCATCYFGYHAWLSTGSVTQVAPGCVLYSDFRVKYSPAMHMPEMCLSLSFLTTNGPSAHHHYL